MIQLQGKQRQHEQCNLNEQQLYEDLSSIIKKFKIIFNSMDNIAILIHKSQLTIEKIQSLKQTVIGMQNVIKQYSYIIPLGSEYKMQLIGYILSTYHRFFCRLMQLVSSYKIKFQSIPFCDFLCVYVKRIEQIILSYEKQKNLGLIIKKIQTVLFKFCAQCVKKQDVLILGENNQSNEKIKYNINRQQQNGKQFNQNGNKSDVFSNNYDEDFNDRTKKPKRIIESKSQNNLNKLMFNFNKRYKVLNCLDIEYQTFKHIFFKSNDSNQQLYQECFQRNHFINKQMVKYSKQFNEYLQRREKKIHLNNLDRKNIIEDDQNDNVRNKKVNNINFVMKRQKNQQINFNFTRRNTDTNGNKKNKQKVTINKNQSNQKDLSSQVIKNKNIKKTIQNIQQKSNQDKKDQDNSTIRQTNNQMEQQQLNYADNLFQNDNSKPKKNIQLKKVDICLTNINQSILGQLKSIKGKSKTQLDSLNRNYKNVIIDQRINQSLKKNLLLLEENKKEKNNEKVSEHYMQLSEEYSNSKYKTLSPAASSKNPTNKYMYPALNNNKNHKLNKLQYKNNEYSISRQVSKYYSIESEQKKYNEQRLPNNIFIPSASNAIKNFRKLKMNQIQKTEKNKLDKLQRLQNIKNSNSSTTSYLYLQLMNRKKYQKTPRISSQNSNLQKIDEEYNKYYYDKYRYQSLNTEQNYESYDQINHQI